MSRRCRFLVFAVGAAGLVALFAGALGGLPEFGGDAHPYRDRAVAAAWSRATTNAVASVNFEQRALDTLGEEMILLGSVLAAAVLLRPAADERDRESPGEGRVLPTTVLAGYLLLPVTLVLSLSVVAHGAISPGGGFQGGVLAAGGLHLLYLAGSYGVLRRLRPDRWAVWAEAAGAGGFVAFGLAGLVSAATFLAGLLPTGEPGRLASAGTVLVLNLVVGLAVFGGVVELLARFLRQEKTLVGRGGR